MRASACARAPRQSTHVMASGKTVKSGMSTCGTSVQQPPRAKPSSTLLTQGCQWLASSSLALLMVSSGASAEVTEIFTMKCAGCHTGGGNIVQAGATLFNADLIRNGVVTQEELYNIIYKGKGKMPGFGTDCAPRGQCTFGPRLTDEGVSDLAKFVREKADAEWK